MAAQHFTNDKEAESYSFNLIDGDGTFNANGLHTFVKQANLEECGVSFAVVAIMGRQSSGKSTLLNHLFYTNFREMNAEIGRSQTTKGIWMARCAGIKPCTIVMDLEGSDGRERGEDDTAFEKQSALFALAVSDIVLINMWCHDIGCEQAANKPILKIVFQVMLRLFTPRKTTLMFVIRDKTRTPLEVLERTLREDIQKIWDGIPKPQAHEQTPLSNFFNVQVVGLSSYEEKRDQFEEQVANLRLKFNHSVAPGGLAGDRQGVVPASGFSLNAEQIWNVIKENRDLDLPAQKVMVALIRCEEIANEKFSSFSTNEDWRRLKENVENIVPGFGMKINSLIGNCLSSYDEETTYYEETSRSAKRNQLEDKLIQFVQPTYELKLDLIRSKSMDDFKQTLLDCLNEGQGFAMATNYCTERFMTVFDELCQDADFNQGFGVLDTVKDKFLNGFHSHIALVRTAKLGELIALYKTRLERALYGPVGDLLVGGEDDTWRGIRELLRHQTEIVVSEFSSALSPFDVDKDAKDEIISELKIFARELVEGRAREEAKKVLFHLKERFVFIFNHDQNKVTRIWTESHDIDVITKTAKSSALKLLSVLAAIRLDGDTDTIWNTLVLALGNPEGTHNLLDSNAWEEVPVTKILITPVECMQFWKHFQNDTAYTITQAIASQNASKKKDKPHPFLIALTEIGRGLVGHTHGADDY